MNFKIIFILVFLIFYSGCQQYELTNPKDKKIKIEKKYKNSGFALIYNENLQIKNLEDRSLQIYHKNLKKKFFS